MRVLYVEDDDNLAFAVEQMLSQAGHVCDRARSGAGAVKLGQEQGYDVILLDVMLPDIDGYEVLRQLQEVGVETPVLIQSGLVERDRAMDGLGFGVDDYLIKPFNRDELIAQVQKAAARGGRATPADAIEALPDVLVTEPPPADPPAPEPEVIPMPAPAPVTPDAPAPEPPTPEPQAPEPPTAAPEPLELDPPLAERPPAGEPEPAAAPVNGPDPAAAQPPASPAPQPTVTPAPPPPAPAPAATAAEEPPLPSACPELPARIVGPDGEQPIDCTIVSLSSGGAVLDVYDETVACPDVFMLAVAGDKSYRCESCWRHAGKLGVKFA